jgi:SET domain
VGWAAALGSIAAALQLVAYLVYLGLYLKGKIEPNAVSWYMFAYGTALMVFLESRNDARWSVLALPIVCALMSVVVATIAFHKRAVHVVDRSEKITFGLDVCLTILYVVTAVLISGHSKYAVAFLVAGNITTFTSFAPLVRSTLREPGREQPLPWLLWTAAYALLLIATVQSEGLRSPELLLYPAICVGLHGIIAWSSRSTIASVKRRSQQTQQKERLSDNAIMNTSMNTEAVSIKPSSISGRGVHAETSFAAGQEICVLTGTIVLDLASEEGPNCIGIGRNVWIDPELPLVFLNHSCEPNSAFATERSLVALRPIGIGEEVTMDYSTTEADTDWTMNCRCGSSRCRKILRSIQIAFADCDEVPPASSIMQQVWIEEHLQYATSRNADLIDLTSSESEMTQAN